ncbi:hypothetical protein FRB94_010938 [Tulasnella sp. JGI-2019a]|nr:hypothetical protein FRB94_010938 [Tulasnella sp. JGI-2019a]
MPQASRPSSHPQYHSTALLHRVSDAVKSLSSVLGAFDSQSSAEYPADAFSHWHQELTDVVEKLEKVAKAIEILDERFRSELHEQETVAEEQQRLFEKRIEGLHQRLKSLGAENHALIKRVATLRSELQTKGEEANAEIQKLKITLSVKRNQVATLLSDLQNATALLEATTPLEPRDCPHLSSLEDDLPSGVGILEMKSLSSIPATPPVPQRTLFDEMTAAEATHVVGSGSFCSGELPKREAPDLCEYRSLAPSHWNLSSLSRFCQRRYFDAGSEQMLSALHMEHYEQEPDGGNLALAIMSASAANPEIGSSGPLEEGKASMALHVLGVITQREAGSTMPLRLWKPSHEAIEAVLRSPAWLRMRHFYLAVVESRFTGIEAAFLARILAVVGASAVYISRAPEQRQACVGLVWVATKEAKLKKVHLCLFDN